MNETTNGTIKSIIIYIFGWVFFCFLVYEFSWNAMKIPLWIWWYWDASSLYDLWSLSVHVHQSVQNQLFKPFTDQRNYENSSWKELRQTDSLTHNSCVTKKETGTLGKGKNKYLNASFDVLNGVKLSVGFLSDKLRNSKVAGAKISQYVVPFHRCSDQRTGKLFVYGSLSKTCWFSYSLCYSFEDIKLKIEENTAFVLVRLHIGSIFIYTHIKS